MISRFQRVRRPRPADMGSILQRRWFQIARRIFRWFRILVAFTLLLAVVGGIYLNEVGLPNFLKTPFLEKLRQNGIEARFARMRLRWYRGVVVENVTFTRVGEPAGAELSAGEMEFGFVGSPLRASGLKLKSILVRQGRLKLPAKPDGTKKLEMAEIHARLLFPETDFLKLEFLNGTMAGVAIQGVGNMSHISAARDWPIFKKTPGTPEKSGRNLERLLEILDQVRLSGRSVAKIDFTGDARQPGEIQLGVKLRMSKLDAPWGSFSGASIEGDWVGLHPAGGTHHPVIRLTADDASTKWGGGNGIIGQIRFEIVNFDAGGVRGQIELGAAALHSPWVKGTNLAVFAEWARDSTNSDLRLKNGEIRLAGVQSQTEKAARAKINFNGSISPELFAVLSLAEPVDLQSRDWRTAILLDWKIDLTRVESGKIKLETLSAAGNWRSPQLQVNQWESRLYGGRLFGSGSVDESTRRVTMDISSELDPHRLASLLPTNIVSDLRQFRWEKPPALQGRILATIPSGTARTLNWDQWKDRLEIAAHFTVGRFSFREIPMLSASSEVIYTNQTWMLPDLKIARSEGMGRAELMLDAQSEEYRLRIFSGLDPGAFRLVLGSNVAETLDLVKWGAPPEIHAEIKGQMGRPGTISVTADVGLTNIQFRGEAADFLKCSLQYSNQFLRVHDLWLERGGRFVKSPQIDFDARSNAFYFTNVYSTFDPMSVTRAIGADVHAAVAPYQFAEPPAVVMNGVLSGPKLEEANLHFQVDGGKFHWLNFDLDAASARIHWVNDTLLITNMQGKGYRGEQSGWAGFKFSRTGTDFNFDLAFADVDLSALLAGIRPGSTNTAEGILHGNLVVTAANDHDAKSYQGHGQVNLRDGLLWEIPIFGVFSPALNAIIPGLGKSKMREAAGHFTITNSVIYTQDTEIRASAVSLRYRGSVDFEQQVNARVEAEVMKDAGSFGKVVTFVFSPLTKLFEYKVTGTLNNPKTVPLHIPRLLLIPLHPFHTLKELLPEKPAPPAEEPPAK